MKEQILHAAMFTPVKMDPGEPVVWGIPVVFEDEPGVGKSAVIRTFAKRMGLRCKVLNAQSGEGAYGVVPVPLTSKTTGRTRLYYPEPDWTDPMTAEAGGLVFCDEITSNPALIQAAQMSLILDREIGSCTLPGSVRVVGACNPTDIATNGHEIGQALANRCVWLKWDAPSVEEHKAYLFNRANRKALDVIDTKAEEKRVLDAWPEAYAWAIGLETGFLDVQGDWKNKRPKKGEKARAWPSDRSWEMAVNCLAAARVHNLSESDRDELLRGCIGAKAYEAWSTFMEQGDLPKTVDVLDGKESFTHNPARLDRSAVFFNSATALVTTPTCARRKERSERLWRIFLDTLTGANRSGADTIVPCVEALIRADLCASNDAVKVMSIVQPAMSAANAATKGK